MSGGVKMRQQIVGTYRLGDERVQLVLREGSSKAVYKTRANAERAYRAYLAGKAKKGRG